MKRMLLVTMLAVVLMLAISVPALAAYRDVPGGYGTIQAAIVAAQPGDTVRVAPGTYYESIYLKDSVTVQGAGAGFTTIIGNGPPLYGDATAAVWAIGVHSAKIDGFTIIDSYAGIWTQDSDTVITNNAISGGEGAIANWNGSPTIDRNYIGGGDNNSDGIASSRTTNAVTSPTITNNMITGVGWNAIYIHGCSGVIANNVIVNNGNSGIRVEYGSVVITNNTIADNGFCGIDQDRGDAGSSVTITNNIITGNEYGVHHEVLGPDWPAYIDFNDIYGNTTANYMNCSPGPNNISEDPVFKWAGNYHLRYTSPCIDAGSNAAPGLPSTDFEGDTRPWPVGGIVDIGADEYHNLPPVANAGVDRTLLQTSAAGADVVLDGSASSDPDGDPLTYEWTWDGGGAATGANPTVTLAVGTTVVTLVVNDGAVDSAPATVRITVNHAPPVADAGPDQTLEQMSLEGTSVTLDGSGSSDFDAGTSLTYTWTWAGGSAHGLKPTISLPAGVTTVTLRVAHGTVWDEDEVVITVNHATAEGLALLIGEEAADGQVEPEMATGLLAKVKAALAALDRANPNCDRVAINNLKALINHVEAQSGKKITGESATAIIAKAKAVIVALGG